MKLVLLFVVAVLGLISVRCSNSEEPKTKTFTETNYLVHGDPIEIVRGSKMSSDLTTANMHEMNELYQFHINKFSGISEAVDPESAIKGQQGRTDARKLSEKLFDEKNQFKFVELGDKKYSFENQDLKFNLLDDGTKLKVVSVVTDKEYPIDPEIQHISIKKDKSAMSIMVFERDKNANFLYAFYFTKKFDIELPSVEGDYDYLFGKNVKIYWPSNEPISLSLCGEFVARHADKVANSIKMWIAQIPHRKAQMNILETYPPFSDLNNHCMYVVDNYISLAAEYQVNSASTVPILRRDIVDSDILLNEREINKIEYSYKGEFSVEKTITHEIGHFLGLGHPTDLYNKEKPSIMSYENRENAIFPADKEAISKLYQE